MTTRIRNIGSYVSFQQFQRRIRYSRRADTRHAAMIDGTFALQARAALHRLRGPRCASGPVGPVVGVVGRAEDGDRRDAERGGDVHGSGIVGEVHAAGGGQIDELGERRFAREVLDGGGDGCGDRRAQIALVFRAEDGDGRAKLASLHGWPIRRIARAASAWRFRRRRPGLTPITTSPRPSGRNRSRPAARADGSRFQTDAVVFGQRIQNAGPAQQLQIVEAFMPRNLARLRNRDGLREQKSAAIASVADALGNACQA